MQFYYISLNIPKSLYSINFNLKYYFLKNNITKKFIKFFCYNFFCLFFTVHTYFRSLLKKNKQNFCFKIYQQFLLQYTNIFFYLYGLFRLKLLAVGSGYFFEEVSKHIVNFYLGYSHLITVETDKNILITVTGRKQRILVLQSHDLLSLRNLGFFIKNLHTPDVYRGKGIRYLSENLILKKGKKKFV